MCVLPVAAAQLTSVLLVSVLLQVVRVSSEETNYTIDDQLGDSATGAMPAYSPSDAWAQGDICTTCGIHPGTGDVDLSQVFDRTWVDSTYRAGGPERVVSVSFAGTAVYVFNLIANNFTGVATFTNLMFFIDNDYVGQYIHEPDSTPTMLYRVPVYVDTSLSNSEHSLRMVAGGPTASLLLFDYIEYTRDDGVDPLSSSNVSSTSSNPVSTSSPSSSLSPPSSPGTSSSSSVRKSSTPVGTIIGGTVGGVCALIVIAAACLCVCRGRASRSPLLPDRVDPFIANPTAEVSPGQPVTRWLSRAPILSGLKLERTRLTPETRSSTSTSSGIPDPHRPHLPSLSVAGTNRSQLHVELVRRIQALEAQMRILGTELAQPSSLVSGSRRGSRPLVQSQASFGLRTGLSALQHEIAELRVLCSRMASGYWPKHYHRMTADSIWGQGSRGYCISG